MEDDSVNDTTSNNFSAALETLQSSQKTWLVTGVAGFIGCNLLETLLKNGQKVVGLDNFETGFQHNLQSIRESVGESNWQNFTFIEGDIRKTEDCARACDGADVVLHQAALGSVPRSIDDPVRTNASNIDGFLNMLVATKDAGIKRFVYAASSSTYGDHPALPKVESVIGAPLSPYAVTKYVNELYATVFARHYGLEPVGLRYFNVFGPRQSPQGAYAAVIPKFVDAMLNGEPVAINGDGSTSRDFCFIQNVVQVNILAALAPSKAANEIYNVALNAQTSLTELADIIGASLKRRLPDINIQPAEYRDFRAGDVRHSRADISKATQKLGYEPTHTVNEGMEIAIDWYLENRS